MYVNLILSDHARSWLADPSRQNATIQPPGSLLANRLFNTRQGAKCPVVEGFFLAVVVTVVYLISTGECPSFDQRRFAASTDIHMFVHYWPYIIPSCRGSGEFGGACYLLLSSLTWPRFYVYSWQVLFSTNTGGPGRHKPPFHTSGLLYVYSTMPLRNTTTLRFLLSPEALLESAR